MRTFEQIKEVLQKRKKELREQYGITAIGIFGSSVKGTRNFAEITAGEHRKGD